MGKSEKILGVGLTGCTYISSKLFDLRRNLTFPKLFYPCFPHKWLKMKPCLGCLQYIGPCNKQCYDLPGLFWLPRVPGGPAQQDRKKSTRQCPSSRQVPCRGSVASLGIPTFLIVGSSLCFAYHIVPATV